MKTEVIRITKENLQETCSLAAKLIRQGELVAFPTETVYGLGGDALNKEASQKIYAAKGRPSDNPLIAHIADMDMFDDICDEIPKEARMLAKEFWPGPLTMILRKKDIVPKETTGGLDTVAVRMPDNQVALELIRQSGTPIAAPSANTSGRPSPTSAEHVYEDLNGRIPMILDGGDVIIGIESTIIDLSGKVPTILRPGYITPRDIERLIGPIRSEKSVQSLKDGQAPKAPGMKYRHYAPKAELILVSGERAAVVEKINNLAAEQKEKGINVAILCTDESTGEFPGVYVRSLGSRNIEEEIASNLFSALREFDETDAQVIYSECFEGDEFCDAIMNRLLKAAAHRVIKA